MNMVAGRQAPGRFSDKDIGNDACPVSTQILRDYGLRGHSKRESFWKVASNPPEPTICMNGSPSPETIWGQQVLESKVGRRLGVACTLSITGCYPLC
jgi:hypothetical protein